MSVLHSANLAGSPDHDVLSAPYKYDIIAFNYVAGEPCFGTLDLTLQQDGTHIVLRFIGVHELELDAGFPHSYMGLEILDVSHLGWEHARVRVQGFEEDAPGIRFWACSVRRVEA